MQPPTICKSYELEKHKGSKLNYEQDEPQDTTTPFYNRIRHFFLQAQS